MSIHVALNHVTHYRYDRLVGLGPQVVRLRPAPHCRTRILSYSLKVAPSEHFVNWQQDPESNYLARFVFPEQTRELRIEVDLVAEMAVLNPFDFFLEPYAEHFPFEYQSAEKRDLAPYLVMFRGEPRFKQYLAAIGREKKRTIDFLVELNLRLSRDIRYLIRMEPGVQSPEQTLVKASGSCRDSAWRASIPWRSWTSADGIVGSASRGSGSRSDTCRSSTAKGSGAAKGRRPVTRWYSVAPSP